MLLAHFRQTLHGVCQSLSNLTISPGPAQVTLKHPTKRSQSLSRLRIGTYNVQSIVSQRQLDLLPEDLRWYRIDILGLQKTHLFSEGELHLGGYDLLTLPTTERRYGIGFAPVIYPHTLTDIEPTPTASVFSNFAFQAYHVSTLSPPIHHTVGGKRNMSMPFTLTYKLY
ncbi:LOW QUALITY PROTEIN: hypothetical protein PHMEG_0002950 [Phytophthora megakarya]|uniref:Endonuclease/exonuclease/phosphatase domain-containing protein n=1 Tax=Phytophthora megakarya TaxID=4795 RepID=A0A225WZN2_9STRA|nr:LOW QUALITY PROTEIN: hypothetical protein PHMEG_0002950 [Phytophthora megakarya]